MKHYKGTVTPGDMGDWAVTVDGKSLDPRLDLVKHSPDGFAWGYGGSGPAQLALALLADASGDDAWALANYQMFKDRVIAGLGMEDDWDFSQEEIKLFGHAAQRTRESHLSWGAGDVEIL